jgi:biofilm PGA synthesis N-glycosyltransferase PgaC
MLVFAVLISFFTLLYVGVLVYFIKGAYSLRDLLQPEPNHDLGVSLIIPAYNEEAGLEKTLKCLLEQDYQGPYEIICINDRSVDRTAEILNRLASEHSIIKAVHIDPSEGPVLANKKRAMSRGIEQAQYEILMSTDGDCVPPKTWITSMVRHFSPKVDIVQGPKQIIPKKGFVHRFQQLETLGFTLIEGSFFAKNQPLLASAPSLAYRKELFLKSGGFENMMDMESGDDDILVQNMATHAKGVTYNADPDAQVRTGSVGSWNQLFSQHARWASNSTEYENKFYVFFLMTLYLYICWLGTGWAFCSLGLAPWSYWLIPIGLKAVLDFWFGYAGAKVLNSRGLMVFYPIVLIMHLPLVIWAVPAGRFKLYKW